LKRAEGSGKERLNKDSREEEGVKSAMKGNTVAQITLEELASGE